MQSLYCNKMVSLISLTITQRGNIIGRHPVLNIFYQKFLVLYFANETRTSLMYYTRLNRSGLEFDLRANHACSNQPM